MHWTESDLGMATRALVYIFVVVFPLALVPEQGKWRCRTARFPGDCTITDLGESSATCHFVGINDRGHVIGSSNRHGGVPVLRDAMNPGQPAIELVGLYAANGMNNHGQIAGVFRSPRYGCCAGVWASPSQRYEVLSRLTAVWTEDLADDVSSSWALDVNDYGQVAGIYSTTAGLQFGFVWDQDAGICDLGTLLRGRVYSATGVNNASEIVGCMQDVGAFFWSPSSGLIPIDSGKGLRPAGLNNSGWVVGKFLREDGSHRAFLWHRRLGLVRLNDLLAYDSGWDLVSAADINDRGQIVGWGSLHGKPHEYLLQVHEVRGEPIVTGSLSGLAKLAASRLQ